MILDHRRILATGIARLRAKIKYHPVVFELMPDTFTLLQLQRCVEALAGRLVHKQNFRRLVEQQELVEETGQLSQDTGGRPAKLFRFRRDVLLRARDRRDQAADLPVLTKLILNPSILSSNAQREYNGDGPVPLCCRSEYGALRARIFYAKVSHRFRPSNGRSYAADIDAIQRLKREPQRGDPGA